MNYSNDVLESLSRTDPPGEITMAPNAPPVVRTIEGIAVALNVVLDAGDVADTLKAFNIRASQPGGIDVSPTGSFSFGMQDEGRISVTYMTQRNSKVVNVRRVPFRIPTPADVCADPSVIGRLMPFISGGSGNLVTLHGPSRLANALVAYLLLSEANQKMRRMIFVVERSLTYLMAHADSMVIQSEIGNDVETFAKGIASARRMGADLLYLGNVAVEDALPGLVDVLHSGATVLVSGPTATRQVIHRKLLKEADGIAEALCDIACVAASVVATPERRVAVTASDRVPLSPI
jgi:twitching motility protein PilT